MKQIRIDSGSPVPIFQVSWNEDKQYRMDPGVVTELLCEQVPVLDFVRWRIDRIEPGFTESTLPLNAPSTNQHFTHQAALFVLAADYTGGTALASLIRGWPVVGVHPVTSPQSVSMWLLKGEVKFMRPSVADLTVRARISDGRTEIIKKRFLSGKTVIETIEIEFFNGDVPVAEASLTYFARQSEMLRTDGVDTAKVNTLYQLKLTSSAEMIAGVRARESGRLFDDPFAAKMAGEHGLALATRFCQRSPELGGMVASRTWHLDRAIRQYVDEGGRDLVIIGVGWDMRPFRMPLPPGMRILELDFPTTLLERERRIQELGVAEQPGVERVSIPIDVRTMPLADVLEKHAPADRPVFLAWEGMSMYFQEDEIREILDGMLPLLHKCESLLWVDLVDKQAIRHPESFSDSVVKFMRGMQILGEPFTFGVDSVDDFMAESGFECQDVVASDVCLGDHSNPVYDIYRFCVASARPEAVARKLATRFDAGEHGPPAAHISLDAAHVPAPPPASSARESGGVK